MILSFKSQFLEPIMKGSKIHTIREDNHNRWFSGRMIHMATGARTKKYKQFDTRYCTSVQNIEIIYNAGGALNIFIDDKPFYYQTRFGLGYSPEAAKNMLLLSKNDGFYNISDFVTWFNKDFTGKIIHWTDFKY